MQIGPRHLANWRTTLFLFTLHSVKEKRFNPLEANVIHKKNENQFSDSEILLILA